MDFWMIYAIGAAVTLVVKLACIFYVRKKLGWLSYIRLPQQSFACLLADALIWPIVWVVCAFRVML